MYEHFYLSFATPCELLLQEWAGNLRGQVSQLDVRPLFLWFRCFWRVSSEPFAPSVLPATSFLRVTSKRSLHILCMKGLVVALAKLCQHTIKHAVPLAQYVINNAGIAEWDKLEKVTAEGLIRHASTGVLCDMEPSPDFHICDVLTAE